MIPYGTVVRDKKSGLLRVVIPAPDSMALAFGTGDFLTAAMMQNGRDVKNEKNVEIIGHINDLATIELLKQANGFLVRNPSAGAD